jgi:hypothetical protein
MKHFTKLVLLVICLSAISHGAGLEHGFRTPPSDAKPRTWWHWMAGNITREGITADLEAMKTAGLGGATILDISEGIPKGAVRSLSPEWFGLVNHALQEAARLGLEITLNNCPGWSSSGGPWIKPVNAMKEIRFTETYVDGGKPLNLTLEQPKCGRGNSFYRDIAVLAFPSISGDNYDFRGEKPELRTNLSPKIKLPKMPSYIAVTQDVTDLLQGNWKKVIIFDPFKAGDPQHVTYEFPKPYTAGSLKVGIGGPPYNNSAEIRVSISGNGQTFKPCAEKTSVSYPGTTVSFDPVSAKFFRVEILSVMNKQSLPLHTLSFSPGVYIPDVEAKAYYKHYRHTYGFPENHLTVPGDAVIRKEAIVNISQSMDQTGRLAWNAPKGKWTILRFGYVAKGTQNHPANPEATGLECDKLSKAGVDAAWSGMVARIVKSAGPLAGKSLTAVLVDSYEVGPQNWTDNLPAEFNKKHGYDIIEHLPILTGRYVESADYSERFLQDFRTSLSDLFATYYGGYFAELAHQNGLKLIIEPYGGPFDELRQGSHADIPMGEFWAGGSGIFVDMPANVAHVNGKRIVQAESFTSAGGHGKSYPAVLKKRGDLMFAKGVNRFIFHTFAHQPWTRQNGMMTMGPWGSDLNRNNTIWGDSSAWLSYISRSQFLLQQGRFVADALYVASELQPSTATFTPSLPYGYAGCCVAAADVDSLTVKDGRVMLPSEMTFPLLIVNNTTRISPDLLQKVKQLAEGGANVLLGKRPETSIGLQGYRQSEPRFAKLVDLLWGASAANAVKERKLGNGRVFVGTKVATVLQSLRLKPDFAVENASEKPDLRYLHRKIRNDDIYFISNQSKSPQRITFNAVFRVAGSQPEFWDAVAGEASSVPLYHSLPGSTVIPMTLRNSESIFVVFRGNRGTAGPHLTKAVWMPGDTDTSGLVITQAVWRGIDHVRKRDVTALVAGKIKNGTLNFPAVSAQLGGDVAHGVKKELAIEYTKNGEPGKVLVLEYHRVKLECDIKAKRTVKETTPAHPSHPFDLACQNESIVARASSPGVLAVESSNGTSVVVRVPNVPKTIELNQDWQVSFPDGLGAPNRIVMPTLESLSKNRVSGVKFFSGTATYRKSFEMEAGLLKNDYVHKLDLGEVMTLARVIVNGADLGVLWHSPYELDITRALKPGTNRLEIQVTNPLLNRMLGDAQLPDDAEWKPYRGGQMIKAFPDWFLKGEKSPTGRIAFTTYKKLKGRRLMKSGLIGPVKLQTLVKKEVK